MQPAGVSDKLCHASPAEIAREPWGATHHSDAAVKDTKAAETAPEKKVSELSGSVSLRYRRGQNDDCPKGNDADQ